MADAKNRRSKTKNKAHGNSLSAVSFLSSLRKPSRILIAVLAFACVGVILIDAFASATLVANYEPTNATYVNNWRAANGRAPLSRSQCLTNAARAWSLHMANTLTLAHSGENSASLRAFYSQYCPNAANVRYMGENVASLGITSGTPLTGEQLAVQFFNQWKSSYYHNKNMLDPGFYYVGYGAASVHIGSTYYYYGTQSFANCGSVCSAAWTNAPAEVVNVIPYEGITVAKVTNNGTPGYWTVRSDGKVETHGAVSWYGDMYGKSIYGSVINMSSPSFGKGYWIVTDKGKVYNFGAAGFYGDPSGKALSRPVIGMASTKTGKGYWLAASDGGVFSYGDAAFYGSMGGKKLNAPVFGMAANPAGGGYWLVATDGGIFSFGSAHFYGSMGGKKLAAPVVGMAPNANGTGYWLLGYDGGIFSFGSVGFYGSAAGKLYSGEHAVRISATADGKGYWIATDQHRIFKFGDAI